MKKTLLWFFIFIILSVYSLQGNYSGNYSDIFTVSKKGAMFTNIQSALDSFVKLKKDTVRILVFGSMPYESINVDTSIKVVNIKGVAAYGFLTETMGGSKLFFNKDKTSFELEYLANFSIISNNSIILYANKCTFDSINISSKDTSLIEFTCCEILDYFKCISNGYFVSSVSHHAPLIGFAGEISDGISDSILYIYKNPQASFTIERGRHNSFFKWKAYRSSGGLYTMRFSAYDGLWLNTGLHVDKDVLMNGEVVFNKNLLVKKSVKTKNIFADTVFTKTLVYNKKVKFAECNTGIISGDTIYKKIDNEIAGEEYILGWSSNSTNQYKYILPVNIYKEINGNIKDIFIDNDSIIFINYKKYGPPDSVEVSIFYRNFNNKSDTLLYKYKLNLDNNNCWIRYYDLFKKDALFNPEKMNIIFEIYAPSNSGILIRSMNFYLK